MNLKRAAWMGVLLYIASFVLGMMTLMITPSSDVPPPHVWYVGFAITIILTGAFTSWYFQQEKPSLKNGLYLGLAFFVVSSIIEGLIIIIIILFSDAPVSLTEYYSELLLWVTVALMVGTSTAVGWWKGKK